MKLLDRVLGNSNDYNLEYLNELLARIAPKEKEIIVKQKKNYGWAIALGAAAVTAAAGYACYKLFIEKKDKYDDFYDDFEDFDDFEDDFDFDDDELEAYLAEKREEAGEKAEEIKDTVKTKAEEVKDTAKAKAEEVKDAVKEKAEEVKDKAEAVADKVKEAAQELKK